MIVGAPAKINLTLEVTGIESNGYHTLDTIFAWLELEDRLEIKASASTSLEMVGDGVSTAHIEMDESNLILKALRAVEKVAQRELPTEIQVLKRIPAGGGLGGGSADAAATLVGLNEVHQLGLSVEQLLKLAAPLGADVSFGLVGGMARGTRYGDVLQPLPLDQDLLRRDLVLVLPNVSCPTPQVYGLWDEDPSRVAQGSSERFLSCGDGVERLNHIANDLEEPAFCLYPRLRELKGKMMEAGLEGVCLSGSGSTLFGFLPLPGDFSLIRDMLECPEVRVVKSKLKAGTRFGLVS